MIKHKQKDFFSSLLELKDVLGNDVFISTHNTSMFAHLHKMKIYKGVQEASHILDEKKISEHKCLKPQF